MHPEEPIGISEDLQNQAVDPTLALGIDIGGTKIAAGVVNAQGRVLEQLRLPTPAHDGQAVHDSLVALIDDLGRRHPVGSIGVAAAGFIDAEQSTVRYAPNIAWRDEPLRQRLEARYELPVLVDNDANAAGWAEYRFGAGRGASHLVMLTLGTGVGGAIINDGVLLRGAFGAAAELGHLRVVPDGRECGCGQRGCLEQYASGRALLRAANELADHGAVQLRAVRERDGELGAENVAGLLRSGDVDALAALAGLGETLGAACASLAAVLDPELFVLGGGLSAAGDVLCQSVRRGFETHLPGRTEHPAARAVVAELGNDAGMVGAADLARTYAATGIEAK